MRKSLGGLQPLEALDGRRRTYSGLEGADPIICDRCKGDGAREGEECSDCEGTGHDGYLMPDGRIV